MAERGIDPKEEKKSYGSVFRHRRRSVGGVVPLGLSGRQHHASPVERHPGEILPARLQQSQAAYDEEDKKLQADANYQELSKKLAAFQAESSDNGELGKKLRALESEEAASDGQVSRDRSKS